MPKKKAPALKPKTHFEVVPLEVVEKIAALDTPSPPRSPTPKKK